MNHLPACTCLDCIVAALLRDTPDDVLPEDRPTARELPEDTEDDQ